MEKQKQVLMVMPVMKGGGAERVASLLMNEFAKNEYDTEFVLACCSQEDALVVDLNKDTKLTFLREMFSKEGSIKRVLYRLLRVLSSLLCKPFEAIGVSVPVGFAYLSFVAEYRREIAALRKKIQKNPQETILSFLQPTIPITLLAARGLPNRVIISERGNPERLMKSRYGYGFVQKYYERADKVVFQTRQAMDTYPANISAKGTVICNPIKEGLPEPYRGERNKNITTFCRISKQKNLPMLVEAFALVHKEFPEYRLRIIGDSINAEGDQVLLDVKQQIKSLDLMDCVIFEPFQSNIHEAILKDAMYVNSSDYEGISNAMLEAMAIGMPVVCTDCPVGGAAAVIENGVNGLLVEVGNHQQLAEAMETLLRDEAYTRSISAKASKIRKELSLTNIGAQWMELME